MSPEEIKATRLTKLVERLFVIDSKLTGETTQLVSEYNEVIEEIWGLMLGFENIEPEHEEGRVLTFQRRKK